MKKNKNLTTIDEKEILRKTTNEKNLEQVRIQIELIKKMENDILNIKKIIKSDKKEQKYEKIYANVPIVMGIFSSSLIWYFLFRVANEANLLINTNILTFSIFSVASGIVGLVPMIISGIYFNFHYNQYLELVKNVKGCEEKLNFLEKSLINAKKELEYFQTASLEIIKITTKEQNLLELLDSYMELYYDCGVNGEDYFSFYQNTKDLPTNIKEKYNSLEQDLIKDYLSKNSKKLVRKK